jgi:hypothetical protein
MVLRIDRNMASPITTHPPNERSAAGPLRRTNPARERTHRFLPDLARP